ncbi:MAG: hypothetical protein AAB439_01995 [Patescibacteria group bacterium]
MNTLAGTPITFTVFGATGDLFARKIIPSLYFLYTRKKIPESFSVIGFGRHPHTTESFREYVFINLKRVQSDCTVRSSKGFLELFHYHRGEFHDVDSFTELKKRFEHNDMLRGSLSLKSFYLAVPPELVRTLVPHIASVAPKGSTHRNILIEKPFGKNEETARALNAFLDEYFDESEIFRIDHYLAKPVLQKLLHARRDHHLYETLRLTERIKEVTVTLFEEMGVEKRGAFYDGVGALRDVGQNHHLEMLALSLMEIPDFTPRAVCSARESFIASLPKLTDGHIIENTTRAQYETYQSIPGVAQDSRVETYFDIRFALTHAPHKGVPVRLRGGKRMSQIKKDVVIEFDCDHTDSLHIELEPVPRIYTKKGSLITTIEEYKDEEPKIQYADEYAQLFLDSWHSDHTRFPTKKEVELEWIFADPILETWEQGEPALKTYIPGGALPWETD